APDGGAAGALAPPQGPPHMAAAASALPRRKRRLQDADLADLRAGRQVPGDGRAVRRHPPLGRQLRAARDRQAAGARRQRSVVFARPYIRDGGGRPAPAPAAQHRQRAGRAAADPASGVASTVLVDNSLSANSFDNSYFYFSRLAAPSSRGSTPGYSILVRNDCGGRGTCAALRRYALAACNSRSSSSSGL